MMEASWLKFFVQTHERRIPHVCQHLLVPRSPDRRHRPCPADEGDLLLPLHRHRRRRPARHGLQPHRRARHHHQRRSDRRHRRQRRHLPLPRDPRRDGRARQRHRRLRRVRPLGREPHPFQGRRAARHLRPRCADLHRRLLQLPHRRLRHDPRDRQPAHLPREARLPH